jgi:hypothetical protein
VAVVALHNGEFLKGLRTASDLLLATRTDT